MSPPDPTPSPTARPPTRFTAINVPRETNLRQQAKAGRCLLEPPCQQGRHGFYFSPVASMNYVSNRLGRYHMTEEGLKHDLGALKRGEIYHKDDFLVRVRAWYKAEIGRLTHLDKVHEASLPFQAWARVRANVNTSRSGNSPKRLNDRQRRSWRKEQTHQQQTQTTTTNTLLSTQTKQLSSQAKHPRNPLAPKSPEKRNLPPHQHASNPPATQSAKTHPLPLLPQPNEAKRQPRP